MGNKINTEYPADFMPHRGRREILTDAEVITRENVCAVLQSALNTHRKNRIDIQYLWRYYKGWQPILAREKAVREEINHKIVENRANQIVNFKVGYCFGEPIQYISKSADEQVSESISDLNAYVFAEDKATKDKTLADWNHICGIGYRMILPDTMAGIDADTDEDSAPFELYTMDPRNTFVVMRNTPARTPMMGVTYITTEDEVTIYSCYTRDTYFEINDSFIIMKEEPHILGEVPIIEYPLNQERMGCFEVVLPLLDAMNETASDRQNGLDQFIQALMLFQNVDITEDDFQRLKDLGAIKVKDIDPQFKADVRYLVNDLNQDSAETLVEHQYQTILEIVGMPNRNGGSSTSDTGVATIVRDGWSDAEARAKNTEEMFKVSERKALKLILKICRTFTGMNLKLRDIEIRFTRRNYENILQKSQVLITMLSSDKIAPKLAFEHCGMFADPERAYLESEAYMKEKGVLNEQTNSESTNDRGVEDYPLRTREPGGSEDRRWPGGSN